jgi:hypothetical protein
MSYKVTLIGAQPHEQTPAIAVYAVDSRGKIGRKLAVIHDNELDLPEERGAVVAFGPDVADAASLDPKGLVTVRLADQLPTWQKTGVLLPPSWWRPWIGLQACVSGTVMQCTPRVLGPLDLRALALGQRPIFETCVPVCNAVVQVWRSTTCCWPFLITDVPPLIDKLKNFLAANPVMFPTPSPGPVTGPKLAQVDAALGAGKISNLFVPSTALAVHLQTLQSLAPADAVSYFEEHPILWPIWCNSSAELLGETTVNPDGSFSFCYSFYPLYRFDCRTSYFYKVQQFVNGALRTIYDGAAANQYFAGDEVASLQTQGGLTCYQPGNLPGNELITLQAIGGTGTYNLNSNWNGTSPGPGGTLIDQTQTGDTQLAALPNNAGLTVDNGAPWGTTLNFLLNYDPNLQYAAVCPVYYRFSIVQADAGGGPLNGATPTYLLTPLSWAYYDTSTPQVTIAGQSLGPQNVNGTPGLYQIPYPGIGNPDWLGGQFHQSLDTTQLPNNLPGGPGTGNGQFLLILEVFDANGNRLVPQDATAPQTGDMTGTFNYIRWLPDGVNTANVPYNALTHVLWVDNRKCVAAIEYFMNSSGTQICQFYQEDADTPFYVGFEAYHAVMCDGPASPVPPNTFMDGFSLTYQEGLSGNTGTLASGGDTNWANGCAVSVGNAISTAIGPLTTGPFNVPTTTFGDMLSPETACSFSIILNVAPKHTDGNGTILGYGASMVAAVALADVDFCAFPARKSPVAAETVG